MTLYHFGNCVALVYVPFMLTYKYSGLWVFHWLPESSYNHMTLIYLWYRWLAEHAAHLLKFNYNWKKFNRSEYGAFWKCVQASGIYVFTQLCKMLVLATFFPDTSTNTTDELNLFSVSKKRLKHPKNSFMNMFLIFECSRECFHLFLFLSFSYFFKL